MIDGLLLLVAGAGAGLFGSLLGLGGGILIVPLLTLAFGLPLLTAVGISLICVIVTSSAAAGVFLERRVANLRLGMTLELFTACGAMAGGLVAFLLPERLLEGLFTALLVYVAITMARRRDAAQSKGANEPAPAAADDATDPATDPARAFIDRLSGPGYRVRRLGFGVIGSVFAGVASALLGIGGGLIKVPVMHVVMGVPLRVATATSNLMIGITASASAIIYLLRGGIDPYAAAPTAIGVFIGASVGSRIASRIDLRLLRGLFVAILLYTAWQMLQRAIA
ncbi:MAG TPA: sulfite exporter TauE/SafE family protein [Candidatus Acidoferrum sp.]|nr:sulfite exporter TauE/SafE family protein [Candidatus Acidoferrum sp.]